MRLQHAAPFLLLLPAAAFVAGIVLFVLKVDGRVRWNWRAVVAFEVALIASSIGGLWLASQLLTGTSVK